MKLLSRTEEILLLAVHATQPEAYGVAIRKHLKAVTGKRWSVGAVYIPLWRLEEKGLLRSNEGEPTPERGGRSKRFYELTGAGVAALNEVHELHERLWAQANLEASRA